MRSLRPRATAAALTILLTSLALVQAAPTRAAGSADSGAVTVTRTVTRTHLEPDGTGVKVDSRNVKLKVEQTKNLHSRQSVRVSWSGARPTAGTIGDPNSAEARQQEYPLMLVECRGVDSTKVPLVQQLRPETCWTGSSRERFVQDHGNGFPPWRLDRYESAANRKANVGLPNPVPDCYDQFAPAQRSLHFVDVKGRNYSNGGDSCPDVPPESVVVGNVNQPPNTTYAVTQLNGTGSAKFTVWTSEDNASLGCGGAVKCALVAVPIMGISCDVAAKGLPPADQPTAGKVATAAQQQCEAAGSYRPGEIRTGGTEDKTVSAALWFSASNWRNRITVPLEFAPLNNVCDITGARPGVDVYGSELAAALTTQWRPTFCLDRNRIPFKHVQVGEPQAANLLKAGTVTAALVSDPPSGGYTVPTVNAPVTFTGFAVSYVIDDAHQDRYGTLKLTPRLLAKLLTQSYPGLEPVKQEYHALSHNPLDMSQDPEFIALNPGLTQGVGDSAAASTLLSLSSDSDVVQAVTAYINADPEARDWIKGVSDPWGMVINPSYKRIKLPVANWPLRDSFEPKKYYNTGRNECLLADPLPILPLIAAPTSRLANTALAVQFGSSSSQIVCQSIPGKGSEGAKLVAEGRQNPGYRFVIAVTSLGDARRYSLDTAALETYVKSKSPKKFSGPNGRTFIAPSDATLRAAAKLLKPQDASGTWTLPYDRLANDPSAAGAYPGSMLVYLAAPTQGLSKTNSQGIAQLLRFAAGQGQTPGLGVGQLPPGYLPLTDANGLGPEAALTVRAADAVAAQRGQILNPSGSSTSPTSAPVPPVTAFDGSGAGSTDGSAGGSADGAGSAAGSLGLPFLRGTVGRAPVGVQAPQVASLPAADVVRSAGITPAVASGLAGTLLPLLVLVGLIGGGGAALANRLGRPRRKT